MFQLTLLCVLLDEQVLHLLNNADEKGLQKLNMVGPKNASSIAAYREQHGTFYSVSCMNTSEVAVIDWL
jgi:Holliday junction resolvasome RuvABC DNA-binding subunit